MNPAIIPIIGSALKSIIGRAIPDKDKAQAIQHAIEMDLHDIERTELKGAVDIILAEAQIMNPGLKFQTDLAALAVFLSVLGNQKPSQFHHTNMP